MIGAAARHDRGLFQRPQTGRRLARVEDFRARFAGRLHEFSGQRGHAAEALKEIQGDPLGCKNRAGGAAHFENGLAAHQGSSIGLEHLDI
jgi:hypothetical protein